jgi:ankyrin repeat protein
MLAALRRALQRGADPDFSALMLAARHGDTAGVLALVSRADVNARGEWGRTALFHAAQNGHTETVRALAACGADVSARDDFGRTPVWAAASFGHAVCVQALEACGADVESADAAGATPLFAAASQGNTETVRALAACGADVSAADHRGRTPVWAAAEYDHTETVRALAACGADVSAADHGGRTPVWAAAEYGHTPCVRALAACGADVSTASTWGETPLFIAAMNGHTETVRALAREFGADVDTTMSLGFTPLHAAAQRGHAETVWTLVREGGAELHRAREQRLAFAMALHPRLGGGSRAYATLDEDMLRMVLGPHVASGPAASEMAAENGHARAARVLKFLEEHEGLAPVHAAANAARRAGFECPVCLESAGGALALAPCGHQVCRGCWAQMQSRGKRCPLCRDLDPLAVDPGTFPASAPLRQRFCVQVVPDATNTKRRLNAGGPSRNTDCVY